MKFTPKTVPRKFRVGIDASVTLSDCGTVALDADEQVTFVTDQGGEYDVTRKAWGFYATPSLNGRLPRFGLRPVLVKNTQARWFVVLVEKGAITEAAFQEYVRSEQLHILGWLDDEATLAKIEAAL